MMNNSGDRVTGALNNTMHGLNSQMNNSLSSATNSANAMIQNVTNQFGQSNMQQIQQNPNNQYVQQVRQIPSNQVINNGVQQTNNIYANQTQVMQSVQSNQTQIPNNQTQSNIVQSRKHQLGKGIILQRGQKTNIQADNIQVRVGWEKKDVRYDLDISAFMLTQQNKVVGEDWFVFYGQPESPDKSMYICDADNNDDGIVSLNLNHVNPEVKKIVFVITINDAIQNNK